MAKKMTKLDLGGSLIIDNAANIKEKFDKKVGEGVRLVLHSDSMNEMDLTGMQLLNYMMVQSGKKGTEIEFKLKLEESQGLLLANCGFATFTENLFS